VLQCVTACCSLCGRVLKCCFEVAVRHSSSHPKSCEALQCGAICCNVLQRVAVCVLQCVAMCHHCPHLKAASCCSVLHCVAVRRSVLQYVAGS